MGMPLTAIPPRDYSIRARARLCWVGNQSRYQLEQGIMRAAIVVLLLALGQGAGSRIASAQGQEQAATIHIERKTADRASSAALRPTFAVRIPVSPW
jgi:hypothetical protein